jgi:hypothetical protein
MADQLSTHDSQLFQQHFDMLAVQLHQTCNLGAHLLDSTLHDLRAA